MNKDGYGRAQFVKGEGTLLNIETKEGAEGFYIKPFGSKDQWVNLRNGYFSNWVSSLGHGDDGSAIRFYAVADVDADIAKGLVELKSTLKSNIEKAENLKGEGLGYYGQSAIDAVKSVAEDTEAQTADILKAIKALNPNQPQAGVLYRIVSAYPGFEEKQNVKKGIYTDGSALYWADVDTKNPTQYWMFEPADNGGRFYLKSAIAHNYVYAANSMSKGKDRMVEISWPVNKNGVPVANLRTGSDNPFHANGHNSGAGKASNIIGYGSFGTETGGASAWYIIPASFDDIHSITKEAIPEFFPATEENQVGLYKKDEVDALALACNGFTAATDIKEAVTIFDGLSLPKLFAFSADKYYRFVNVGTSATYKYDVTLGVKDNKAFCSEGNKENIDFVWQVIPTTGDKYFIKNANGKNFLQPVQNGQTAQTAMGERENAYELRRASAGVFKLYSGSDFPAQVETNAQNTFYLNGWDGDNAKWKVFEIESVDIPLNTAASASYATAYLPFSVSSAEGADLYTGVVNGDVLNLTKSHEGVAAEQAIVLIGESGAEKATVKIGEGTATSTGIDGTLTPKTVAAKEVLTLGKSGDEVGFFAFTGTQVAANKAYINGTSGVQGVRFIFDDVTGIHEAVTTDADNAPIYDLSGRRVVKTVKGGLYIQNGKKFIVR